MGEMNSLLAVGREKLSSPAEEMSQTERQLKEKIGGGQGEAAKHVEIEWDLEEVKEVDRRKYWTLYGRHPLFYRQRNHLNEIFVLLFFILPVAN